MKRWRWTVAAIVLGVATSLVRAQEQPAEASGEGAGVPKTEALEAGPALPPAADEPLLGARIPRVMAILQSGREAWETVRIVFCGPEGEKRWIDPLVAALRARYPAARLEADSGAVGRSAAELLGAAGHELLRARPDLIVVTGCGGDDPDWDRVLTEIRRRTTAEIMIASAADGKRDSGDATALRGLAARHGAELVDLAAAWKAKGRTQPKTAAGLRGADGRWTEAGTRFVARVFERHFRLNPLARPGWADTVRRHDAMRFLEEGHADEIVLEGDWRIGGRGMSKWAQSHGTGDVLRLKFIGARVDLLLAGAPKGLAGADILIDGRKPSELAPKQDVQPRVLTSPTGVSPFYAVDEVSCPPESYGAGSTYTAVTIADGLAFAPHELLLKPRPGDEKNRFGLIGVDVHRPPLWGK